MIDDKTKIKRMEQSIEFAKGHVDQSNITGAVVVGLSVLEQIVAYIKGEDLDHVKDPDATITFVEDCGDGEDQQQSEGS